MFQKKIGLRIRELRKKKNISQLEASMQTNIDKSYWNYIENGKFNITVVKLKTICDYFEISLKEFFDSEIFREDRDG